MSRTYFSTDNWVKREAVVMKQARGSYSVSSFIALDVDEER